MNNRLKGASEYPEHLHLQIVKALYEKSKTFSYSGLYLSIKEIAKNNYIKLGNNKAKLFAKYYYNEAKFIIKKDIGLYLVKPL